MKLKFLVNSAGLYDSHAADYKFLGVALQVYADREFTPEVVTEIIAYIESKLNETSNHHGS